MQGPMASPPAHRLPARVLRSTSVWSLAAAALVVPAACRPDANAHPPGGGAPATSSSSGGDLQAATGERALEIHDRLEARISAGEDDRAARKRSYEQVLSLRDDGSAAYALARAALAGRVAESRGAGAGKLVTEAERWARRSRERDPNLRDGAATRLLGSLYVMAPARLLEHGDSETGLELLEDLVERHPEDPRARLRLAEAYVALGDPDPAFEHLCVALAGREQLPGDERRLLERLVDELGPAVASSCEGEP